MAAAPLHNYIQRIQHGCIVVADRREGHFDGSVDSIVEGTSAVLAEHSDCSIGVADKLVAVSHDANPLGCCYSLDLYLCPFHVLFP